MFRDLETPRLFLRCISPDDRAFIFRQFSDADVCRYLYDEEPFQSMADSDKLITLFTLPEPRAQHRWILVRKEDGEKLGTCGFHAYTGTEAEVGYDMRRAYWGKGYMTEAMGALLPFARDVMGVRVLRAHIFPENERSIRVAAKMGFRFEGETILYTFRGQTYLHHIYTLRFENEPRAFEVSDDQARVRIQDLMSLLAQTGWANQRDEATVAASVRHSLCFGAYRRGDGKMIGFARVITDYATSYYLCDVIVDGAHRGCGVGKALLDKVVYNERLRYLRGSLATVTARALYERYGFRAADRYMYRSADQRGEDA